MVNSSSYLFEIETCWGLEKDIMTSMLEVSDGPVSGYYPSRGAYETRSWPPPPQEVVPHLPAILTATASTVITADYLRRIARWFLEKRATDARIPATMLRIRRREGSEPLLDVELETVDAHTVERVIVSLLDDSDVEEINEEGS